MPLAIAGLALGAVGTGLSMAGNAKAQSQMEAVRAANTSKQAALQKQSQALFQSNLDKNKVSDANTALDKGANARTNAWQDLQKSTVPIASALPATSTGSTSPTGRAQKAASGAAQTWNALNAKAAADEGAYGDWQTTRAVNNAETAQKLGVNNNFAAGDAAMLPVELESASHAGDGLSGWGSIVGTLGSIASGAGSYMRGANAAANQAANVKLAAMYG